MRPASSPLRLPRAMAPSKGSQVLGWALAAPCKCRSAAEGGERQGPPRAESGTAAWRQVQVILRRGGVLSRSGLARDGQSETDGKGLCLPSQWDRQLGKRLLFRPCWGTSQPSRDLAMSHSPRHTGSLCACSHICLLNLTASFWGRRVSRLDPGPDRQAREPYSRSTQTVQRDSGVV